MDKRTLSKKRRNVLRRTGKPMGRPQFDGKDPKDVWEKLCEAWKLDCSDEMACRRACISVKAMQMYIKANPHLLAEKEFLKHNMLFRAKERMREALDSKRFEGFEASRFVLERRDPLYKQKSAIALGEDKDNPLGTLAGALIVYHKGKKDPEKESEEPTAES